MRPSSRRPSFLLAAAHLGLLTAAAGCGASNATAPSAIVASPPRAELGALTSLIPADATLVVLLEPERLMTSDATRRAVLAVTPEAQLERFSIRTGLDPRTLGSLVYAATPNGELTFVQGPFDSSLVIREAGARMAPLESAVDHPFLRRAGFLGDRRVELIALAPNTLVRIDGPPELSAAVLDARSTVEPSRAHPFLEEATADLFASLSGAPLVIVAPQPLRLPIDRGVGMLLARERALGVSASAGATNELTFRAELRGAFPPGARENVMALAESIADTDLGAALGARDALATLRVSATETRISASATAPAGAVVTGLRAVLGAEIQELIETDRSGLPRPGIETRGAAEEPRTMEDTPSAVTASEASGVDAPRRQASVPP